MEFKDNPSFEDYYDYFPDPAPMLARLLDDGTFAIGQFNMDDHPASGWDSTFLTETLGVPESSGKTLLLRDIFTGEEIKVKNGCFTFKCPAHDCRMYIATVVDA